MARHPETEASQEPNKLLMAVRLRLTSPNRPGRRVSRDEFADLINNAMDRLFPGRSLGSFYVSGRWVGAMERGERRWTSAERRAALRDVAGIDNDYGLGLYEQRDRAIDVALERSGSRQLDDAGASCRAAGDSPAQTTRPPVSPPEELAPISLGVAAPALRLDDLERIEEVGRGGRRYSGDELNAHLSDQLARCAAEDGLHGPRHALPGALGILSTVQRRRQSLGWTAQRRLLRIGARAAEFAGWLYRDLGHAAAADYWRDRATEWAMEAADYTMPGYILLKKSQSAWDARDAIRMLGLARAVQEGPWRLPSRVMAEALQQQARGLAMVNGNQQEIDDTLSRAQDLLYEEGGEPTLIAAHYDGELFKLQTAICYGESGRPEKAAEIYTATLKSSIFSARDFAYFSALQAQVLVAMEDPDEAASVGSAAFTAATATGSARTLLELSRVRAGLQPWRARTAVKPFLRLTEVHH